jgi:hypothetical protein
MTGMPVIAIKERLKVGRFNVERVNRQLEPSGLQPNPGGTAERQASFVPDVDEGFFV